MKPPSTRVAEAGKVSPEQVGAYIDRVCEAIKARLSAGEPVEVSEELVPPDYSTKSVTFTFRAEKHWRGVTN